MPTATTKPGHERGQLLQRLGAAGFNIDVLDTAPDAALIAILKLADKFDAEIRAANERKKAALAKAEKVEHFSDGGSGYTRVTFPVKDAEVALVEQHYERFSEEFGRYGLDKAALVAGFESARKRKPSLTAAQHLDMDPEDLANPAPAKFSEDLEVTRIETAWFNGREYFERHGIDLEKFRKGYQSALKRHPKLTAREYLS